jgi:hypothetical protein
VACFLLFYIYLYRPYEFHHGTGLGETPYVTTRVPSACIDVGVLDTEYEQISGAKIPQII